MSEMRRVQRTETNLSNDFSIRVEQQRFQRQRLMFVEFPTQESSLGVCLGVFSSNTFQQC